MYYLRAEGLHPERGSRPGEDRHRIVRYNKY